MTVRPVSPAWPITLAALAWPGCGPTPPPAPTPMPAPAPVGVPGASRVVAIVNAARASRGLPPYAADPRLAASAGSWAGAMARAGAMAHGDWSARIGAAVGRVPMSECVAAGQRDAAEVVAAWMADPPHRAILLGRCTSAGAGVALSARGTAYWCLDVATP